MRSQLRGLLFCQKKSSSSAAPASALKAPVAMLEANYNRWLTYPAVEASIPLRVSCVFLACV
jgi:hypothetical protein